MNSFIVSFLTALSGAMSPGPLLTYTIVRSIQHKKGYLMGGIIIAGHALLEMGVILLLLAGFSFLLKNPVVIIIISVLGGAILLWMGICIIRNVITGKVNTGFLKKEQNKETEEKWQKVENPVLGGILVSMSNPYWWIWWGTLGLSLMVQLQVSFKTPGKLLAFFLGHEAGDLVWYIPISILAYMGREVINKTFYYTIMILCALGLIGFGLYLSISTITGVLA